MGACEPQGKQVVSLSQTGLCSICLTCSACCSCAAACCTAAVWALASSRASCCTSHRVLGLVKEKAFDCSAATTKLKPLHLNPCFKVHATSLWHDMHKQFSCNGLLDASSDARLKFQLITASSTMNQVVSFDQVHLQVQAPLQAHILTMQARLSSAA